MRLSLSFICIVLFLSVSAQNLRPDSLKRIPDDIDVNFLWSYYDQDGEHSAVTGGKGSESLQEFASILQVNIPLDSSRNLTMSGGITYYTSASNDKIDFRISSASRKELRGDLELALGKFNGNTGVKREWNAGISLDVDYLSTSVGYSWSQWSMHGDREWMVNGTFYYDSWVWVIYPFELRGTELARVPSEKRLTYNLGIGYRWTINQRLQGLVYADPTYQHGLLSVPFHRVYFSDTTRVGLERLPLDRFKLPLALRLHYFPGDWFTVRFYYRYYWDNFGITASTFNLELPVKLSPAFALNPFYRFHTQTASDHFKPTRMHLSTARYATSDYDLSGFHSHRYGMGLRISPVGGIGRFKWNEKKQTEWKGFELRYSQYRREDGLEAWMISGNFSFVLR